MKLLVLLALMCNFSFADDGIGDFKLGCKDPGAFHNQNPPSDIKVSCFDERITWQPTDNPDEMVFKNKRTVCSKGYTNKPNIKAPKVCIPCDWPDSPFTCGGFKEVEETAEMQFSVTCDEILTWESIGKFCQMRMLTEVQATDGKILTAKNTGRTIKVCGLKNYFNDKPMDANWTPVQKTVVR